MVVVDTNVIVHFFMKDDKTEWAHALWHQDPNWILPDLWKHEFLNVLCTVARVRPKPPGILEAAWQSALGMLGPCEHALDFLVAFEMAKSFSISGYDAQFLSLARQLETVLITEDKELLRKAPHLTRPLSDYKP